MVVFGVIVFCLVCSFVFRNHVCAVPFVLANYLIIIISCYYFNERMINTNCYGHDMIQVFAALNQFQHERMVLSREKS